ncbi:GumC family protein [Rhizobium sp. NTR19]|uniref:GumC family protein n=1 Tax=Neorhizobium turbinariae TaxID=2937795 RepID=A0ABT0INV9_9HYPH|nr:GumC family protein [Neorhizobium turbinariae]MCK8779533.1 GumC family protein [Neorhizobium turbinariae]
MYTLKKARHGKEVQSDRASDASSYSSVSRRHGYRPGYTSLLSYPADEAELRRPALADVPEREITAPVSRGAPSWQDISGEMVIQWLWRGRVLIGVFLLIGALAGIVFGQVATRKYTVNAQIFVDPSHLKVMAEDLFAQNSQLDAQLYDVESKLRILTSSNVLNSVIQTLKLDEDPEFAGDAAGDASLRQLEALRTLEQHVGANREEGSFIVNLSVWSEKAPKALRIANTIVETFREELIKAQAGEAGRTATELFARLDTLKEEVAKADEAVQRFRRENNILSSSGELVSTLVANQTNTQLVEAQARVIRARSRYQELSTGNMESRLDSASIESQTMTALRTQYSAVKRELDAQAAVFGARHPRLATMRPQLEAIQAQINAEQRRLLEAAKSELAQAEASLMAQQSQVDAMKSVVFEDNEALVQLRQLEREFQSKSSVYDAFMGRAREIAERQQISTTNIRIISPPAIPKTHSFPPRNLYLLIGGAVAGAIIGCAAAVGWGLWGFGRRRTESMSYAR